MKTYDRPKRGLIRYRKLREQGLCARCKAPLSNGKSKCGPCLERERRRRAGEELESTQPPPGFCTEPLCDVLEKHGLKVEYMPDAYRFTGRKRFTWKKSPGDTPFDALRAKGVIA